MSGGVIVAQPPVEDDYPDDPKPAPAVTSEPKTPFGWCLTGHHRDCRKTSSDGRKHCTCKTCGDEHGVDYVPWSAALPPDIAAIVAKYNL